MLILVWKDITIFASARNRKNGEQDTLMCTHAHTLPRESNNILFSEDCLTSRPFNISLGRKLMGNSSGGTIPLWGKKSFLLSGNERDLPWKAILGETPVLSSLEDYVLVSQQFTGVNHWHGMTQIIPGWIWTPPTVSCYPVVGRCRNVRLLIACPCDKFCQGQMEMNKKWGWKGRPCLARYSKHCTVFRSHSHWGFQPVPLLSPEGSHEWKCFPYPRNSQTSYL